MDNRASSIYFNRLLAGVQDFLTTDFSQRGALVTSSQIVTTHLHVRLAKQAGASRDEVISALLIGLPAAGNAVTQALPAAIQAYDSA